MFSIQAANPLYDHKAPLVRELEHLAFHIIRIREVKRLLDVAPPLQDKGAVSFEEELIMYAEQEEAQRQQILNMINSVPAVQELVVFLLKWIKTDHIQAYELFVRSLEMYKNGLSDIKSSYRLAALLVIVACQLFENEDADQSRVTAVMIRDRVYGLAKELRCRHDFDCVKWWQLFLDLGIKLKFPRSRFKRSDST